MQGPGQQGVFVELAKWHGMRDVRRDVLRNEADGLTVAGSKSREGGTVPEFRSQQEFKEVCVWGWGWRGGDRGVPTAVHAKA